MKLIVAADKNWAIGKDNDLLCHLPGDLKYFKERTTGKTVVMGRKTLESLPGGKPLPKRTNIVLTRDESFEKEGTVINQSPAYATTPNLDKTAAIVLTVSKKSVR